MTITLKLKFVDLNQPKVNLSAKITEQNIELTQSVVVNYTAITPEINNSKSIYFVHVCRRRHEQFAKGNQKLPKRQKPQNDEP